MEITGILGGARLLGEYLYHCKFKPFPVWQNKADNLQCDSLCTSLNEVTHPLS